MTPDSRKTRKGGDKEDFGLPMSKSPQAKESAADSCRTMSSRIGSLKAYSTEESSSSSLRGSFGRYVRMAPSCPPLILTQTASLFHHSSVVEQQNIRRMETKHESVGIERVWVGASETGGKTSPRAGAE